jgi:CRP-like cAMP-binding protein
MDAARLLEESDLFHSVTPSTRKAIAAICIPRVYRKREILFREGEEGHSMYLLAQGTVQLFKGSPDGKEVVIKLIKPVEIFAEAVLFERPDYPVSAAAITAAEAYLMPKRQFLCLLEDAGFRNDFIAVLLAKQRYLADQIYRLSALDVEARFLHFLRDHFGEQGRYRVNLSKRDVAAAIDALPETLSRVLLKLRDEGAVTWDGDEITVREGLWRERK